MELERLIRSLPKNKRVEGFWRVYHSGPGDRGWANWQKRMRQMEREVHPF